MSDPIFWEKWKSEKNIISLSSVEIANSMEIVNFVSGLSYIPPIYKNFTLQVRGVVCQKDELEYDAKAIGVT